MEQHDRLTFLARHYYDLQGIRLAPLWVAGIFTTLIGVPDQSQKLILFLLGLFAVQILWFWLGSRYYFTHFGWLKPDPLRFMRKNRGWLFWLWWTLSAAVFLYCWFNSSNEWAIFWLVSLMAEQSIDTENPRSRRIYYGIAAAIIVLMGSLTLLEHWDGRQFALITCLAMIAVAVADHMLLLRLLPPPAEEIDG